ncbi:transferrin-a [Periophthalmus magnuspinnatus]|uniref:transferrin-a n=1 Tax=Periophthalmus magnuspinnatus TaxID=409849 RepID=UPI002437365E|nr:transferrin-a [Periophthalmus magnuspinnatus]
MVYNNNACFYSVALAKQGTGFQLKDLRGKKSCHSALGNAEGWNLPIGTLLSKGIIDWAGPDNKPLLQAVSEFFSSSCLPGAQGYPNLCQLCKGDCSETSTNEYYGDDGAFKCLAEGAGDVTFMTPSPNPTMMAEASVPNDYELLCQDNKRAPLGEYNTCNLGREPAHAIVSRKDNQLAQTIYTSLKSVKGFNLFSSAIYGGKDLMFSDTATDILQVPADTDSFLYLGAEYMSKLNSLKDPRPAHPTSSIRWCAVGHPETAKCDLWMGFSYVEATGTSAIECQSAPTVEECFKKIMRQEADAIAVDGGQVYTAGKCGLVPAMAEQYDDAKCNSPASTSSYYSVAVVKKGSGVTWDTLKGKKSCHTGIGRTAGWNIPMGHIHKQTNSCDFSTFFASGCAPGADPNSAFCTNCKGSGKAVGDEAKCKASSEEMYYGYAGAFRCLAEDAGHVAFIKHTIVGENTDGHGPDWASGLRSEDFELICPGKSDPVPISEYASCNLAAVPAHAVVTRPELRSKVVSVLMDQQVNSDFAKFGITGSNGQFRMFESQGGKNLLFKDSTRCLQETQSSSYEEFLGQEYMTIWRNLALSKPVHKIILESFPKDVKLCPV